MFVIVPVHYLQVLVLVSCMLHCGCLNLVYLDAGKHGISEKLEE